MRKLVELREERKGRQNEKIRGEEEEERGRENRRRREDRKENWVRRE